MSSAEAYAAAYPSCMLALGDLNGDGQVNTFDIDLFVDVMGGNLMSARRYQYDEENRLTAVAEIDGNPLLEIEYDALGRRIATIDYEAPGGPQQMRHVYSGLNTVAEYVWSGSQWTLAREFLWGERFPEPLVLIDFTDAGEIGAGSAEVLHYVHDALGSVVGLVDAGNAPTTQPKLVERYDYDPYGKTYTARRTLRRGTPRPGEGAEPGCVQLCQLTATRSAGRANATTRVSGCTTSSSAAIRRRWEDGYSGIRCVTSVVSISIVTFCPRRWI